MGDVNREPSGGTGPGPAFSTRTEWERAPTPLARRYMEMKRAPAAGAAPLLDLTESNPTRAGFVYPADSILGALARPEALVYEPEPLGGIRAREAVGSHVGVDPARIVLTASTSEAYAWLFKLLCEPGSEDQILIPRPSYPLFDYIAQLEGVRIGRYPLGYDGRRWRLEVDELAQATGQRTRGVVVVQPNNPTGSALQGDEIVALDRFCAERGIAIISDEVFADYPFAEASPIASLSGRPDASALSFVLGGLSKAAGLPQMKLSWILVSGPAGAREESLDRLEIIGDTFLSVGTPVQEGAAGLLQEGASVRRQILGRIRTNRETAMNACRGPGSVVELLDAEGGWYAVLRVPRIRTDEEWALELLDTDRVYVHPGYLFDFDGDGYLVVSLLTREASFAEGMRRIVERVARALG